MCIRDSTGRTRDPLRDYAGGDLHGARLSLDTRRRARHAVSYRGVRTPGRVDAPRTGNLRTVGARPVVAGNAAPRRDTRRPARWIRRCAFRESPDADDASLHAAANAFPCLLYTSDAADERSSVDLGGRRIIKK